MKKEKIIIALYPGCISFEVAVAADILSESFSILYATPDGKSLTGSVGLHPEAHLSYAEVNLENCRAVLVPGGDPGSIIDNEEIDRILIEANESGLLIAGICAGPAVLAKAGILVGRKIAHGYGSEQLKFLEDIFKGVKLTESLLVIDQNVITAKPQAHIQFGLEIGRLLGVVDASQSIRLEQHYRSVHGSMT